MKLLSIHPAVSVGDSHVVFTLRADGRYEGEVSDEVGQLLLSICPSPGEYQELVPDPVDQTVPAEEVASADSPETSSEVLAEVSADTDKKKKRRT